MRAAVMRDRRLEVADVPVPEPGPGEVLVRTLACGICGSDLHALRHAELFVETARRAGTPFVMDLGRDVVMGHEFCAEIVEHGPATIRAWPAGTRVCSRPVVMRPTGPQTVGYSNDHPGGYGQYMRLTESLLLPVPPSAPTSSSIRRPRRPGSAGARQPSGATRAARPPCRPGSPARPCAPPSSSSAWAFPACWIS
jgi:threonine dehydrogenase-like Zn-dependent dehydrogenase